MKNDTRDNRKATDKFTFESITGTPTVGKLLADAASDAADLMLDVREIETAQDVYESLFLSAGLAPLNQAAGGADQIAHLDPRRVANLGVHFAESVSKHLKFARQTEKEAA